jgi:hypothetical protein
MCHDLRGTKFSMWQDMNVFERVERGFIQKPIIQGQVEFVPQV